MGETRRATASNRGLSEIRYPKQYIICPTEFLEDLLPSASDIQNLDIQELDSERFVYQVIINSQSDEPTNPKPTRPPADDLQASSREAYQI